MLALVDNSKFIWPPLDGRVRVSKLETSRIGTLIVLTNVNRMNQNNVPRLASYKQRLLDLVTKHLKLHPYNLCKLYKYIYKIECT